MAPTLNSPLLVCQWLGVWVCVSLYINIWKKLIVDCFYQDDSTFIFRLTVPFIKCHMAAESPSLLDRSGCQWAAKTLVWTQKGDSVESSLCLSVQQLKEFQIAFGCQNVLTSPPRPSGSRTWVSQTLWPPRHLSAGRGCAWRWGPCHRCVSVGPVDTSRHSWPSVRHHATVWRRYRPHGPHGQSSSPSHKPAARNTPGHPRFQEYCRERGGFFIY